MKKLLTLLSLILFFIAGLFLVNNSSFAFNVDDGLAFNSTKISIEQVQNISDEGTIQSYSLTDERRFVSKNDNNNEINLSNNINESHIGVNNMKNMDIFDVVKTLSHSNYTLNLSRVYLTQTSPRAP